MHGLTKKPGAGPEDWRVPSKDELRALGQVQSLSRALKILTVLAHHAHGLSLSEVAFHVGLPPSTAHRLLTTLQNERFVRFEAERLRWFIGVQAFRVGLAFACSRDLAAIARPFMRRLVERYGATVSCGIIDRQEVIRLMELSDQKQAPAVPPGRQPAIACALGRALIAAAPESALEASDPPPWGREALKAELAVIRARGYAVELEDNAVGLRCVAAVIFGEHGEPLAGLSMAVSYGHATGFRVETLGEAVAAMAAEITAEMGGRHPPRRSAA